MRSRSRERGSDRAQGCSLELRVPQLGVVRSGTGSMHPVVHVSLRVDGIPWEQVQTLVSAQPADRLFVLSTADDGTTTIEFGDGKRGSRLPPGVQSISACYRDTGRGEYLVYLDVWTREVAALKDIQLRESALGGPDTSARGQRPDSVSGSGS